MGLGQCVIKITGKSIRANGVMAKDTVSGYTFTIIMDIMSGSGNMDNVMAMERGSRQMGLVIMDNGHMTSVRVMRYLRTILGKHLLGYSIRMHAEKAYGSKISMPLQWYVLVSLFLSLNCYKHIHNLEFCSSVSGRKALNKILLIDILDILGRTLGVSFGAKRGSEADIEPRRCQRNLVSLVTCESTILFYFH
jgi:hypothetical protein